MRKPVIYLAGAIRDGVEEDIRWRERAITRLTDHAVLLNPLGGKTMHQDAPCERPHWTQFGRPATAQRIVHQDFWCVEHADIILANVTSLAEGYPSIGTMMELGYAAGRGRNVLTYLLSTAPMRGMANGMFRIHPFLEQIAADWFTGLEEALDTVGGMCDVLSGKRPSYVPAQQTTSMELTG
jgi:nucleoside 2-deoxyribosyltransferase